MNKNTVEKRKYPRIDTSKKGNWKIKVFGLKERPYVGKIVNVSLGGVAFSSNWQSAARTVKRFTTRVELQVPEGKVSANSSLVRILPRLKNDDCLCVFELDEINQKHFSILEKSINLK